MVIKMSEIILKIEENSQRHVGKGIAIIDPKIVEDNKWITGQTLEIVGNKKSHVKLWPGLKEDYGAGIIRIDGLTRHNIGAGIGRLADQRQGRTFADGERDSVDGGKKAPVHVETDR